jgi:GxxExxY protein
MENLYHDLTKNIIGCFFGVYNTLGYGFLEKVYERAMIIELAGLGLASRSQCPIQVYFKEQNIGDYYADIIVEDKIVLELKGSRDDSGRA